MDATRLRNARVPVTSQNPVTLDSLPFILGQKAAGQCLAFDRTKPTKVHLIPRPGGPAAAAGKPPVTCELPACFVFHHANAYEDPATGRVVVDSAVLPELVDFAMVSGGEGGDFRDVDFEQVPINTLWRHTLDAATGAAGGVELSRRVIEFPRINPGRQGVKHRYVYMAAARHPTRNQPLQGFLKFDTETGTSDMWDMGPRVYGGEPEFIPKPTRGPSDEDSDDGWLVGLVFDASTCLSKFVILDAKNLGKLIFSARARHSYAPLFSVFALSLYSDYEYHCQTAQLLVRSVP